MTRIKATKSAWQSSASAMVVLFFSLKSPFNMVLNTGELAHIITRLTRTRRPSTLNTTPLQPLGSQKDSFASSTASVISLLTTVCSFFSLLKCLAMQCKPILKIARVYLHVAHWLLSHWGYVIITRPVRAVALRAVVTRVNTDVIHHAYYSLVIWQLSWLTNVYIKGALTFVQKCRPAQLPINNVCISSISTKFSISRLIYPI